MRVMLKVCMDTEKANDVIRNGTMTKLIQEAVEQIKPEAAYFTSEKGRRTAFLFFDMQDSSQLPVITEPFFMRLGAEVSCAPVMNLEDVRKGLAQLDR
jgi:CRISPR/Cas system endoribonuclease Cas6 (RAMP superfamily)